MTEHLTDVVVDAGDGAANRDARLGLMASEGEPEAHARRSRDRVSPWSQPEVVRPA